MNKEIENQNTDFAWGFCLDHEIASEQELDLATKLKGYNWDTIMDVVYIRTGYRDIEQYVGMEGGAE